MIERTVVGWDGSEQADAALQWAVARGAPTGEVRIVRIVDDTLVVAGRQQRQREMERTQTLVDEVAARVRAGEPGLALTVEVGHGEVLDGLLRFADERTLLVVGTPSRTGMNFARGWSLGGRLAAAVHGQVAIVPADWSAERRGVVVGVDGSATSLAAVGIAAEEAQRRGEALHAVLSWLEPEVYQNPFVLDESFVSGLESAYQQILADSLTQVRKEFPLLPIEAELVRGPAPMALLRASANAALLVVGSRGHRGVKRLVLGSVSRSVVLNLIAPTIVVGRDEG